MEPRLTMWAWGAARSRGRKLRVTRSSPTTLMSTVACQSSSRASATGSRPTPVPALLTSRSAWPWRSPTAAAKASTEAGSVTSRARVVAPTSSARAWRRSVRRAPATTWKPALASRRALAAPIPLDAPVTTAIRSPAMRGALLSAWGRVDPLGGQDIDQAALGDHGCPVLLRVVGVAAGGRPVQAQVVLDPASAPGVDRPADGQPLAPEALAEHGQVAYGRAARYRVRVRRSVPELHSCPSTRAHSSGTAWGRPRSSTVAITALWLTSRKARCWSDRTEAMAAPLQSWSGTPAGARADGSGYATGPGWARQASPAAARSSQNPG